MPEDRIYGDCYGLQICDAHSSTGEIKFDNRSASVASLKRGSDSAGISQLSGKLSYPVEAVLPVSLHYRSLEGQKIWSFQCRKTLREEFVSLMRPRKNLFGE